MKEFKGTKGEWYIEEEKEINSFGAYGTDISSFHERQFITIWGIGNNDKEAEANAKLIAAAPDMLEALNNALSLINTIGSLENKSFDEFFEVISIKNAIKKATE